MKKVLIIEDDPIVGKVHRALLEKEGYQVEVAGDGEKGFQQVHEFHPDAVMLDLMLPKLSGLDLLKKIRVESALRDLPVFVFTNAYVPTMIQEANRAGANTVFNKSSVTPNQIIGALRQVFETPPSKPAAGPVPRKPPGTD